MTEQELYEQDRDNRVNADVDEISFCEFQRMSVRDLNYYANKFIIEVNF